MRKIIFVIIVSMLAAGPAQSDETGIARVTEGDMLIVGGTFFRLHGVDAIERYQSCTIDDKIWACGPVATRELEILVANEPVTCRETGETDQYRRAYAVCRAGDKDLSEAMVRAGMALAVRQQSLDYIAAEDSAKAQKLGVWRSDFDAPWVWREKNKVD